MNGEDILPEICISNLGMVFVTDVRARYRGATSALAKENCHHSGLLVMVTMLPTPELSFWTMTNAGDIYFVTRFGGNLLLFYIVT